MIKRIKKKIVNNIKSNYNVLDKNDFINGQTLFNRRCHINAVSNKINKNYKVLLTICIGNDDVFVHFINQDILGNYIDDTLGWYGKQLYDYYLIREVTSDIECNHIWDTLLSTKRMLIEQNSNWLERCLRLVTEDDI